MAYVCELEFLYNYTLREEQKQLIVPLKLPFDGNVNELTVRLMKERDIPCYYEESLGEELEGFIRTETSKWRDKVNDDVILDALEQKIVSKQVTEWVERYTNNHSHFTNLKEAPENEFPMIYHQLIHSPALNTLLQLEHTYSMAMNDVCIAGKNAISMMQKKHDDELEKMMKLLGTQQRTDVDVNKLMRQQVTDRKNLEDKWTAEVISQQETQKREYRSWLSRLHKDMNDTSRKGKGKNSTLSELENQNSTLEIDGEGIIDDMQPIMEESFTVHLGTQQKSSHNLRLICGNVLSFFSETGNIEGGANIKRMNPRRIETAMSLYTQDLTAIIIMTEREINTISGIKEVIGDVCRLSTDFHFPSIDEQLSNIQEQVKLTRQAESQTGQSKPSPAAKPDTSSESPIQEDEHVTLEPGDFYVTKHSNLSQIQVVCHLISEEKAILDISLSNRHFIMQGLRNSLRVISKHGLHRVVLPLLLTNQMKPEMTINWCLRRAELVFKSVKGFLLENTTWKGNQTWTIQFLLPEGISEELFEQISELLSKTFRTSVSRTLS